MGWIKGALVCFCVPFLTLYWLNGAFAVQSSKQPSSANGIPFGPIYVNPIRPNSGDCSVSKRQQLLNQASILLQKLSPPESVNPSDCANEDLESILIQSLIDRLEAIENSNTQVVNPSRNPLAISEVTYNSIVNKYNNVGIVANNSLAPEDAAIVLSALYDVFVTFKKVITAQLPNVELPNLCSKILALNIRVNDVCASEQLQAAVADFIELLTVALTGQNQVTITAICNCLNDLETSVVTVVQNDKSEKLQTLLNNLVNAVINAIVSGSNSNDIVQIVRNYVASIKEAVKQDAKTRAEKIYSSVLNFEKGLSEVLIKPALGINQNSDVVPTIPSQGNPTTKPSLEFDPSYDASDIVTDGSLFIINTTIVRLMDDDQNVVQTLYSGNWKIVDPKTNVSWSGSFAVQRGAISSDPNGNINIVGTILYDVNLPEIDFRPSFAPKIKSQGVCTLQDNIVVTIDDKGNLKRTEKGTFAVRDSLTGRAQSGQFVVRNRISQQNSDGSINVVKAGLLSVDGARTTALKDLVNGDAYFLEKQHLFNTPDRNGNLGGGLYDLEIPLTSTSESGNFTVQKISVTKNDDGSVHSTESGLVQYNSNKASYVLNSRENSVMDNYGHVTTITSGQLKRTEMKTGQKTLRNYVIPITINIDNPDGTKSTLKFGKLIGNSGSGSNTLPNTPQIGSTDVTGLGKPVLVSKNLFDILLNDLKPVKPDQTPTSPVNPTGGQTDPTLTSPALCSSLDDGANGGGQIAKYDALSIVSENTVFIISEFITSVLDAEGNIFSRVELGTYWFRDDKTNLSWYGAFETTSFEQEDDSPNKMSITKEGTFEVAPPLLLCAPPMSSVEGFFSLTDYVISGENGAVGMTEDGTYSLTDTSTDDTRQGSFIVLNNVTKVLDNGVIQVTKTGFLGVDDPATKSPSERISGNGFGRYFLFQDRDSLDPKTDGNNGTGYYSIKDSASNKGMSGHYVIQQRTITTNPDRTVDITTIGVIYVTKSDFNGISNGLDPVLNVANGARFISTDHLVTVRDVYGHESTFGTGNFVQVDPRTGAIESATYEIKNLATTTDDDKATNTIKFGWIPNNAYTTGSQTLITAKPAVAAEEVFFKFEDHLFGLPQNGRKYGTGKYKINNVITKQVAEGTYDIQKQSTITHPNGTVVRKTSGVIYVNASQSSPTISDLRLTILDGANFEFEEKLHYQRDSSNNVIVTGTGLLTQTVPSSGLVLSIRYEIKYFSQVINPDGSQDVIRSGTITYNPTIKVIKNSSSGSSGSDSVPTPTFAVNDVFFKFEDHLPGFPLNGRVNGTGKYKINNVITKQVAEGTYDIQRQSMITLSNGTVVRKMSGVIYVNTAQSSPTISDLRLTILDGANFEFEENLYYQRDSSNNLIVTGTGVLTQTVPSSGLILSTRYEINYYSQVINSDGSQDVIRSGTITYNPTIKVIKNSSSGSSGSDSVSTTTFAVSEVLFKFEDHLLGSSINDREYGTGKYKINNVITNQVAEGTYDIQQQSMITNPNGTVVRKTSGVIYVDIAQSSPTISDLRLTILDGANFEFEENLYYQRDSSNNLIVTGTGVLTQTVPSSGLVLSTRYEINYYSQVINSDGSQDVIRSGTITYDPTIRVIENSLSASSGSDSVPTPTFAVNDVFFKFEDHLLGSSINDREYGTGKYKINNVLTNQVAEGTYDIQQQSTITHPNGTVVRKTSGVIYVDTAQSSPTISDLRLTILDGANFEFEEKLHYQRDSSNNLIVTGTGLLTQTVPSSGLVLSTRYEINYFSQVINSDESQDVIRSGTITYNPTIKVIDNSSSGSSGSGPVTTPPNSNPTTKPSQTPSTQNDRVSFTFKNKLLDVADSNGNYGSGEYEIKKPATNEYVTGTYIIHEQTSSGNSDGTVTWKTSGVIHLATQKSSPLNSLSDPRFTILDGKPYTMEETVRYSTDVNGKIIATGNGLLTQTDPQSGVIVTTSYTIEAADDYCDGSGNRIIIKSGTIKSTNITNPSNNPVIGIPPVSTGTKNDVQFTFKDHIFAIPTSQGNHGTGEFKITNIFTNEFVGGTYNIQRRNVIKSEGIVTWERSGVIFVDNSQSSSTISDLRLTIIDGAKYTMKDTRTYTKDVNGNVIVHRTGLLTQIIPSTGLNLTTSYTIDTFDKVCAPDGSQDITRSGTMGTPTIGVIDSSSHSLVRSRRSGQTLQPAQTPPGANNAVIFEFNSLLYDVLNRDGNYGSGSYKITKPAVNQQTVGTYNIKERSVVKNSDGTTTRKLSGVIRVQKDKSTPVEQLADTRLVIIDNVQYSFEERLSSSTDRNGNIVVTGTGILTQMNLKQAKTILTYFTINASKTYTLTSGIRTVIESGTIDKTNVLAYLTGSNPNPTS